MVEGVANGPEGCHSSNYRIRTCRACAKTAIPTTLHRERVKACRKTTFIYNDLCLSFSVANHERVSGSMSGFRGQSIRLTLGMERRMFGLGHGIEAILKETSVARASRSGAAVCKDSARVVAPRHGVR